jgi:cation diffusion facilitator CzcD-associated flavoprotein CzcO
MTNLKDKVVALVGTGASGIQVLPPLAGAAKQVYVFQRTPSAIGERGNRPTDHGFSDTLGPGWQRERMDNFQAIMTGHTVEEDLVDDGWTRHYAAVNNPPRKKGMGLAEYIENAEAIDFRIMDEHRRRVEQLVHDPRTAEILKPYYRYICKRPCFHDEYLSAYNNPNVSVIDCPAGFERISERGPVVDGVEYEVDTIIYGTGFEPERTPLYRRAGHDVVGRNGITLAEKWSKGAASLFGMMTRGFPNLFIMPAPTQQAVVTVNYTQLAVAGADFIAGTIKLLHEAGVEVFDVSAEAEADWTKKVIDSYVDGASVMTACTPSRINNEGHPESINPRDSNYGGLFGDWFGYRDLLEGWVADGQFDGLEIEVPSSAL